MKLQDDVRKLDDLVIFYADDDDDDIYTFTELIDELNDKPVLVTVDGGAKLLDALNNPPPIPSIVFVDLNMPGKNGLEVIREIRANSSLKDVPVVVLTTSSDDISIATSRKVGANYYITKASSYSALKQSIYHVLNINWSTFKPDASNFVYRNN